MTKVLINIGFKDKYTGELYTAGATTEMTEERVYEVKEVNPNFVTVLGYVEEPVEEPVVVEGFTAKETVAKSKSRKTASKK